MGENRARWDRAIDALEALYKDVEWRSLSLPALSLRPFGIICWNLIKFFVCLLLDLLLLINAIIFLRNLFPGRWHYLRSFSGSYWKYLITWIWRGEVPDYPLAVIRPLVKFMVYLHIHSRFRNIENCIFLDDTLTDEDRAHLNSKVAAALDHWRRPTMAHVGLSYFLPFVVALFEVYISTRELPQWAQSVRDWVLKAAPWVLPNAIYFVFSAFMFKRSLMLGASGRAIYFPGAISGNQGYTNETSILASVGIRRREWPVDIALSFLGLIWQGIVDLRRSPIVDVEELVIYAIFVALYLLALYRRRKTGRF
jgi:hypothetical protein